MHDLLYPILNLNLTSYWLPLIWVLVGGFLLGQMPKTQISDDGAYRERWRWVTAVLMVLPLILWAGYRPHVGDTTAYATRFNEAPGTLLELPAYLEENTKDKGFSVLIVLTKSLGVSHYRTFFLLLALLQMWCLVYTFRKYSDDYWLSIFLFVISTDYFAWMFNGTRQFTAVCMTFVAFQLLVERKRMWFLLVSLLAYTIHASAILMIPFAYIMQGPALNKKTMLIILAVVICIPFIDRFTPFLETLLSDTQYSDIMTNEIWMNDDGTNIFRVLVYSAPALLVLFGQRYVVNSGDRVMNLCINASILTMAIYLISSVTSGIYVGRIPVFTTFYGYMVLPWAIDRIFTKSSARFVKVLAGVCYFAFFYFQMNFTWGYL